MKVAQTSSFMIRQKENSMSKLQKEMPSNIMILKDDSKQAGASRVTKKTDYSNPNAVLPLLKNVDKNVQA